MGNNESSHEQHKTAVQHGKVHHYTNEDPAHHGYEHTTVVEKTVTTGTSVATTVPAVTVVQTGVTSAPITTMDAVADSSVAEVHVLDQGAKIKEVIEKPEIVQETVHKQQIEEIQPVVHREINKTEVHEITQPIYEKQVKPTVELNKVNATIQGKVVDERTDFQVEFADKDSVVHDDKKTVVTKPAIVEEEVNTEIIEIIQPVIHREVHQKVIIHSNQDIYEKYNEQATVVHEYRAPVVVESHSAIPAVIEKSVATHNFDKPIEIPSHVDVHSRIAQLEAKSAQ
eukprot:TRINITY_DN89_c0_g1_i1.p1 TRINITY_DN89_c0_g1~~TRINITY_DN89_c0_g1_i1.p1  ORF type:complete len:284 (-),score=84.94 TRINITY_DN89_c0_g1_i1:46-897(-)